MIADDYRRSGSTPGGRNELEGYVYKVKVVLTQL